MLLQQLKHLVHRLENTDRTLPRPRNRHAYVDRERWIRQLAPYHELQKLEAEVVRLRDTVVPDLVILKTRAMKAFDAVYGDVLRLVTSYFRMAGLHPQPIKNLKPYYERRRLSQRAKKKRQARAAARDAAGEKEKVEIPRPPEKDTTRVAVGQAVQRWLEKHRLFGT